MDRPPFIVRIEQNDSEFLDHVRGLSNFIMTDGALPAKMKTLMTLYGEAIQKRDEGVRMVADLARSVGVTEDEIKETIRLAFLVGGLPALSAATQAYPRARE
jgi:alkylhydroperoxidase/carboxymuconolactone decarboxylase family protein YurZ